MNFFVIFFDRKNLRKRYTAAITIIFVLFLISIGPARFPIVSIDSKNQTILDITEGSHATVAVIKEKENIRLKLNNNYQLGDSHDIKRQRVMTELSLFIHSNAKSVFFLGLGTGITAGASLGFPVEKVTICELIPEVVRASKNYFSQYVQGLYDDPRVTVVIEDGRNYLTGTNETYDVIIADLFLPWKAGVGNLYTIEHFQTVKSKLNENGIFVQWLPLWQHSWEEFSIIVRTMLEVFDQITLWRANFSPHVPIIALIGHSNPKPLDLDAMVTIFRKYARNENISEELIKACTLIYYSGNLSQIRSLFTKRPLNTDDLPLVEYLSPVTLRNQTSGHVRRFVGDELYDFFKRIFSLMPSENDHYLKNLSERELDYVQAGLDLYAFNLYKKTDKAKSLEFKKRVNERVPPELRALVSSE